MPNKPPPKRKQEEAKGAPPGGALLASPEEQQKLELIDAAYLRYVEHLNKCLGEDEEEGEEGSLWAGEQSTISSGGQEEYLEEGKRIMEAAAKRFEDEEDREDEMDESKVLGELEEEEEEKGISEGLDLQIENKVVSLEKYHRYMEDEYGALFAKGLAVIRSSSGTPLYEDIDPEIMRTVR